MKACLPSAPRDRAGRRSLPFARDESIDYSAWQELLEFLIASGVHGLFVIGGQGEFFALSEEERTVAARFCAQTVAQRLPVYANVGAVTTAETVRLAQKAEGDGVDYLVVITPYYTKPSAGELFEHYSEVCRSVRIPVLAYNIPERTGVELTPAVLRRVAESNENFVGLKDSSGSLDLIPEWKRAGLAVFMGQDHMIPGRAADGLRGRGKRLRQRCSTGLCGSLRRLPGWEPGRGGALAGPDGAAAGRRPRWPPSRRWSRKP